MNATFIPPEIAQRYRVTAKDYWLLADAGAFVDYAKTELIEGEIWVVNSIWAWHAATMMYVGTELTIALRAVGSKLVVYGSGSVDLTDDSVPEPDVSVGEKHEVRGVPLAKLKLAVEVSDTSLEQDLGRKVRLYGSAGVPEYWVVDREGRRIVQMWSPQADGYAERRDIPFGERITSVILGVEIDTSGIGD